GSDVALSESTEIANLVVGASYYDSETGTAYAHQLAMPDLYQNDPIPGDANLDKIVNDLDATILAANWQKATGALWGDGDFDEDGDVDDVDATILAVNWLRTADASATSIPEPHALLILAIGTLCLSLSRVRRF
ncbi:MAG: hypothetical protein JXM70_11935, partial [Pirellulales bacterium]|nr:hypothetical protein [Pirellulales bacterium]